MLAVLLHRNQLVKGSEDSFPTRQLVHAPLIHPREGQCGLTVWFELEFRDFFFSSLDATLRDVWQYFPD